MSNLELKFKKLFPDAIIPRYAQTGDAGLDLYAYKLTVNRFFLEYGTGIAIEVPDGYVGLVVPRSSVSSKGLSLCNSTGVIDSGYRGEIKLRFYPQETNTKYRVGDRIAQLLIVPIPHIELLEIEILSETARDNNGFGSTGV